MLKTKFILLFFFSASYCFSQVEIVPIIRNTEITTSKSARTAALTAMPLPFWDDFSFNIKNETPNDTLWEADSKSVWVNNGSGINPPSIYVATFDGYDATGNPYSANEILAKGFADAMTSRPLKLGDVAPANRNAVFMTFFYQFAGNGDSPEPGDILSLLFKNAAGQWIEVWSKTNDGTLDRNKFYEVTPQINIRSKENTPDDFFHNDFQFQFRSFGRLSGPYDVWNVDYVYVSNGESQYAPFYSDFPDRTVQTPLSSFLKDYWSIPLKHYLSNEASNTIKPYTMITNLRKGQANGQPVDYSSKAEIYSKINASSIKSDLETDADINPLIEYNSSYKIILDMIPSLTSYNEKDSLNVKLQFILRTNDKIKKPQELGSNGQFIPGDYDTIVYKGIKFWQNDIATSESILSDYYAYDDGKAEFGIKLNGKGTQLAYEFNMKTTEEDDVIAIDIYFPKYGDDTNQFIQIFIANSLPAADNEYSFKQSYAVQRTTRNKFVRFKIPDKVTVKDKFYIGWQLNSEVVIPIGLDRNTDSGNKIYTKVLGAANWEQNTTIYGSIMMRPVLGKAPDVILDVEPSAAGNPYPNPTAGIFYLPTNADLIQLFDLSGRSIDFNETQLGDKKQISILTPATGLYFVRYFNQQWVTGKLVVKP